MKQSEKTAYARIRRAAIKAGVWKGRPNRLPFDEDLIDRLSAIEAEGEVKWAAGFIEGEGSFQGFGTRNGQATIAHQVNKEPVLRLQRLFGGTIKLRKRQKAHHNDCWYWLATGSRARATMVLLYRHLSEKRKGQVRRAFGEGNHLDRFLDYVGDPRCLMTA